MTPLREKVQNALDEARMLVLGLQVLIGFGLGSAFEERFEELPRVQRWLKLGSLWCIVVAFVLLITPIAIHQLREHGRDSAHFHRLVTRLSEEALIFFAVAIAIDVGLGVAQVAGGVVGAAIGIGALVVACGCWFGIELLVRKEDSKDMGEEPTKLEDKIRHVLTEARVVLPGSQALLGFQLVATLMRHFERLPASSKWTHLGALLCTAVTVILLMMPAAWHRLVEHGENTERFHSLASGIVVAALVPLALALAADLYVVTLEIAHVRAAALGAAAAVLVLAGGLWFGLSLLHAHKERVELGPAARIPIT